MQNDLWSKFTLTGSVEDYLRYKQNEQFFGDVNLDANENTGIGNKRTDGGRE